MLSYNSDVNGIVIAALQCDNSHRNKNRSNGEKNTMKMDFHKLTMEDKEWLSQAFREDERKACEFSFANNYLWGEVYQVQVAKCCGCALVRYEEDGEIFYAFPCGNGDKKAALEAMIVHADGEGQKLELTGLLKEETELLHRWFPDHFEVRADRNDFDYIYDTQDLTLLAGKKYHGKRNHIARFKDHDWLYETLSQDNVSECRQMLRQWKVRRADKWDELMQMEYEVVENALNLYEELELTGGLIRQEGEVVAFCMGEPLTSDTYVVHFEKAYPEIQGAYPIINQQFVEHQCQEYAYVNREEDDGEEGLRKAKLSYHPVILLEKYRAYLH